MNSTAAIITSSIVRVGTDFKNKITDSGGCMIENTVNDLRNCEVKMQYILDEQGNLAEIPKDKCKKVEYPIKYRLKNAFEVFVRVDGTDSYWISNYGRCVNNLNHKDKSTFYKHKEGKCHYTIYDVEKIIVSYPTKKQKNGTRKIDKTRCRDEYVFKTNLSEEECNRVLEEMQSANTKRVCILQTNRYKRETSPEDLVADTFLVQYRGRCKIWHKDGDYNNNWYKNLLYVSQKDYTDLKAGKITWQELNLEQEYIEYENKASASAHKVYGGIKVRCGNTEDNDNVRSCYDKSTMWQGWLDEPREFVKWYLEHYYECDDEEMDVDKDLFGDGSGMYHPNFCCILPKGLNTLLANSKKHYKEGQSPENTLPLGVAYNGRTNKYNATIQFAGTERQITLSEWDTAEEAFAEYKVMKQADICLVAAKYKGKVPDYIYDKLLKVDVKAY